MCNQKLKVFIWPCLQKQKNDLAPIYLRISIDGKKATIATKHYVNPSNWSKRTDRLKPNAPDSNKINAILDRISQDIKKHFLDTASLGKEITPTELKNKVLGIETAETPVYKTICDAFDYHNLKMEEMVSIDKIARKTLLRYKSSKEKTIAFMKLRYRVADMPLHQIKLSFITEFEHYLLTKEKLHGNTAHKIIKIVKKILNLAVTLDWIATNPSNQFKCSYKNPERIVLTQEEIYRMIEKEFTILRLEEVRDVFIFCCYTGFAYTDIFNFTSNSSVIGLDGNYWLSAPRQKTGVVEKVPLLPIALDIIHKYKTNDYCIANDKLLPVNSNQRYNAYLKEVADLCGIKKKLTTHIARHTFATTVTLANGVPIETVSAMLGHTSIKTTQIYAKVVEKKMSEDMESLRSKLFVVKKKDQHAI